MKFYKSILSIGVLSFFFIVSGYCQGTGVPVIPDKYKLKTIVLDAGHGGRDSGATGKRNYEKDLALRYTLELGRLIEQEIPEVEVLYTRTTDTFIPLKDRAKFANRNNADLFISIHCNGGSSTAKGTETFVLGLHRNEDNLKVAMRENNSILLEDDYNHHYDNFDPSSPEAYILFNLVQNANLDQSLEVASFIENQFVATGRRSRGVKQAGFLVLRETTMPSVLVETGFLTNQNEENYMASSQANTELSRAMLQAVKDYKFSLDKEAQRIIEKYNAEQAEVKRKQLEAEEARRAEEAKKKWAWPRIKSLDLRGDQYFIQLLVSKSNKKGADVFAPFNNVNMQEVAVIDSYKYLLGPYSSREEAEKDHKKAQEKFRDAYILLYRDGKIVRQ